LPSEANRLIVRGLRTVEPLGDVEALGDLLADGDEDGQADGEGVVEALAEGEDVPGHRALAEALGLVLALGEVDALAEVLGLLLALADELADALGGGDEEPKQIVVIGMHVCWRTAGAIAALPKALTIGVSDPSMTMHAISATRADRLLTAPSESLQGRPLRPALLSPRSGHPNSPSLGARGCPMAITERAPKGRGVTARKYMGGTTKRGGRGRADA
jgi:hypothetical protein